MLVIDRIDKRTFARAFISQQQDCGILLAIFLRDITENLIPERGFLSLILGGCLLLLRGGLASANVVDRLANVGSFVHL